MTRLTLAAIVIVVGLSTGAAVRADPGDPSEPTSGVVSREIGRDRLFAVFDSHYGEILAIPPKMRQRVKADRARMEQEGNIFVKAPKTNRYLNAMLSECLTKVGPRPNLPVSVQLVAAYTDGPKRAPATVILANRSGLILISVATLQRVGSPDELGFLLAHEYGHVAMQHPSSPEEYKEMLGDDASDGAKLAAKVLGSMTKDGMARNILRRRHEDHADFYGIDAMQTCRYNTALAFRVLEKIGDWHAKTPVFALQKELESDRVSEDKAKEGLGGIFTGLGKAFSSGFTAFSEFSEHDTRSVQDRSQLLNFYYKEYYKRPDIDMNKVRARLGQWRVFKSSDEWAALVNRYGG